MVMIRPCSPPTLSASSPWSPRGPPPGPPPRDPSMRFDQLTTKPSTAMSGPHTSGSTFLMSSIGTEACPLSSYNTLDDMHQVETRNAVGDGPMRFGPVCRPATVQEDLLKCHVASMEGFMRLKQSCQNNGLNRLFTEEQIFRVAAYKDFSVGKAFRLLKKMDPRFMNTKVQQIEDQLRTQTLFPLPPEVRAPKVDSFFYMRPCRYHPGTTPTSTIIANLIYVMDTIYQRHYDYENHRIGFIANMNDWTMEHFAVDYCFQFMQSLQGRMAPVNVDMFLIVNPPAWFDRIWKIMKPMLSPVFRKKVHMIPEGKLSKYLSPGFEAHLPNEFECGQASVPLMVKDFITFRKYVEGGLSPPEQALNDYSQEQRHIHQQPIWSPNHAEGTKKFRRWMRRMSLAKTQSHREAVRRTNTTSSTARTPIVASTTPRLASHQESPLRSNSAHNDRGVIAANEPIPSWAMPPAHRRLSHTYSVSSGDDSCSVSMAGESESGTEDVPIRLLE